MTPGRAAVLAIVAIAAGQAIAAHGAGTPRCYGAAARDLRHPCTHSRLRFRVTPTPDNAVIEPSAPCVPTPGAPDQCFFGVRDAEARGWAALVGDSHAGHWRGALIGVAAHFGWHGVSLTRTGCPFTMAYVLGSPGTAAHCAKWRDQVLSYLDTHPKFHTIFVSAHPGRVRVPQGSSTLRAKMRGYLDVWNRVPPSVTHIVVIRDTPINLVRTVPCINAAMRRHHDAGRVCAIPVKEGVLKPDPEAMAAIRYQPPRVGVIDLTHYFCDTRCYPVIGGVLVHKDIDHLTALYSETLAPYMLSHVRRLGITQ
jgi:hypothetical protein